MITSLALSAFKLHQGSCLNDRKIRALGE